MSETPGRPSSGAPLLGQDTHATLAELLGLDEKTLARLTAEKVILPAQASAPVAPRPTDEGTSR
jgi:hypothetical protein